MADNLGNGVSRVLDPKQASFLQVIWQEGKPPLDSEFNLIQALENDWRQQLLLRNTPSGWLGNETNPGEDYLTNPMWSNFFQFGRQRANELRSIQWAVVNGWMVPVTGTRTGTPPGGANNSDTWNKIFLDPPPSTSGDSRVDFVFLEVWIARVAPNAQTNKPSTSAVYRYGNIEGGYSYLNDDTQDPDMGFETTQRIQVQYRIRVVGLTAADGFSSTSVKAKGAYDYLNSETATTFSFVNMRTNLGDPGLWRAGDGTANTLNTVDGYSYAIPICHVFRRNSTAWNGEPSPNLNGSFNRRELTVTSRASAKAFLTVPTLLADLTASATTAALSSTVDIPLPTTGGTVQIGDEIVTYTAITGGNISGLVRGAHGTTQQTHKAGESVVILAGRPDGLFADQIAANDILDARHVVNPNGFDYETLLRNNVDKLLSGKLRSTWKRGASTSTKGPFLAYQDKIAGSVTSPEITKLDGPDNIRMVWSDAAVQQKVEVIVRPFTSAVLVGSQPLNGTPDTSFSLSITANTTAQGSANQFNAGDNIIIPVAQFKNSVGAGDGDQVRFINNGIVNAVTLRLDGEEVPVDSSLFTVTPTNPLPTDDLTITLLSGFPQVDQRNVYITLNIQYGGGRGLSRRPDSIHSIALLTNTSNELLLQPSATPFTPTQNTPLRTAWAPLWSKYRSATYKTHLPVTAESFADLGSKTIALTPFRRVGFPQKLIVQDGTVANPRSGAAFASGTATTTGSTTITDLLQNFTLVGVVEGDAVTFNAPITGTFTVVEVAPLGDITQLVLDRAVPTGTPTYEVRHSQGLMPLLKPDGVTSKWTTTDPLGLFSGTTDPATATKNLYVTLPRHLIPGWGEVRVPILPVDAVNFSRGVNFLLMSKSGASPTTQSHNPTYVSYSTGNSFSYAAFSTRQLDTVSTATVFNTQYTFVTGNGIRYAGTRFFDDGRGRTGLELPPFYGIARLFAVYEAADYVSNGSAFGQSDRIASGAGATNLLRTQFDGATFWIEQDVDGDSTFVINAAALDLSKSPNAISSFTSAHYVIEASVFGFDRGSFDQSKPFRLVLNRSRLSGTGATSATRADNFGAAGVDAKVDGPTCIIPAPLQGSDQAVINYSRTPYMGSAFGAQTVDLGHRSGAITSAEAYSVVSNPLDELNLTRVNQRAVEVLASLSFSTTLGTGRLSGDLVSNTALDFRNVGYEALDYTTQPTVFPPTAISGGSTTSRPVVAVGALSSTEGEVNTQYLGCTERLPLGAFFRDKDFRGGRFQPVSNGLGNRSQLLFLEEQGLGSFVPSLATTSRAEHKEVALSGASQASGAPGDIIVHMDGAIANYAVNSQYRTNRGGSAFCGSGTYPGGEVHSAYGEVYGPNSHTNVLTGKVYLVRNTVANVGASEVSAGDELMMLVVTNVHQVGPGQNQVDNFTLISSNGTQEGYAASDLYRLDGHPLVNDNLNYEVNPDNIVLSRRAE